jgi:hypothetical protein
MHKSTIWIASTIVAAMALAGCSSEEMGQADQAYSSKSSSGSPAEASQRNPNNSTVKAVTASTTTKQPAIQRAVIRNGKLSLKVAEIESAEREIADYVAKIGGYVSSTQTSNLESTIPTISMKLQVPSNRFDESLRWMESKGRRLEKAISTEDVTAKLVDYQARLRIMRVQEEQIIRSLQSLRMEDSINLRNQLMELRGQIESLTSQRKELSGLAQLSNIELTLVQEAKAGGLTSDGNWMQESWNMSTAMLGGVVRVLGSLGIMLVVFSPIWGPVVYLFARLIKGSKPKTSTQ